MDWHIWSDGQFLKFKDQYFCVKESLEWHMHTNSICTFMTFLLIVSLIREITHLSCSNKEYAWQIAYLTVNRAYSQINLDAFREPLHVIKRE